MKMEVNVCGVIFMITYFHELVAAGNLCMSKISQMSSFISITGTDYRVSGIQFMNHTEICENTVKCHE